MTRTFLTLAVPLALLAGPAVAAEPTITVTQTVSAAGLDLATGAGRAELAGRIERAVKAVCAPADLRDLRAMKDRSRCMTQARARSRADMLAMVAAARGAQLASAD